MFKNNNSEDGIVLIAVLIAIAILTTLVVDLMYFTQVDAQITSNFKEDVQAEYIARSGVNVMAGTMKNNSLEELENLVSLYSGTESNSKGYWSINVPNFPVGLGMVSLNIIDERSKVNLNALVNQNSNIVDQQVREELTELFGLLDIRSSKYERFIASLINWIDTDLEGSRNDQEVGGANGDFYRSLDKPYYIKDGPLDSLDEIKLIDGMDSDFFNIIKDYVTIYPNSKLINFSTAPKIVLLAALRGATVSAVEGQGNFEVVEINSDIADKIAEEIIAERENSAIISRTDIFKIVKDVDPTLRINSGLSGVTLVSGKSDTFSVRAVGMLGEDNPTRKIIEAVLRKDFGSRNRGVDIISWKEN